MKKNRILLFVFAFIAFFLFAGRAFADVTYKVKNLDILSVFENIESCPSDLKITFMVNGVDETQRFASSFIGNTSCTTLLLPATTYNSSNFSVTINNQSYGILNWYDNAELQGEPITYINFNPNNPTPRTFYASLAPMIDSIYIDDRVVSNLVVGKTYSPAIFNNYYRLGSYVDNTEHLYNDYDARFYSISEDLEANQTSFRYFPDEEHYTIYDSSGLLAISDVPECDVTGTNGTICWDYKKLAIIFPVDSNQTYRLYEVTDIIDGSGNSYGKNLTIDASFNGKRFYTVANGEEICRSVDTATDSYINFDIDRLTAKDFYKDKIWIEKITTPTYNPSYFNVDNTGHVLSYNSCIQEDVRLNIKYNIDPDVLPTQYVTILFENGDVVYVEKGSTYTLPSSVPGKASEVTTLRFKYQDGITSDTSIPYTASYTPYRFSINGISYSPAKEIVVNEDTIVNYVYNVNYLGNDFPTPTRTNYTFKGWYDQAQGGNLVTSSTSAVNARTLYAQWTPVDMVSVVRPDGVTIELPINSSYRIPDYPEKASRIVGHVYFRTLDDNNSEYTSYVTNTFTKDGVMIDGVHYNVGDVITVDRNIVIEPNYLSETIPATFPSNPTKSYHRFIGWYDREEGGEQYVSFGVEDDVILYGHYESTLVTVTKYLSTDTNTTPVVELYNIGDYYRFGYNNYEPQLIDNAAKVTFIYANNDSLITYVTNKEVGDGWIDSNNHTYADNSVTRLIEDLEIRYNTKESSLISPEFPSLPVGYGWYDSTGKLYTSYRGHKDITLYEQANDETYELLFGIDSTLKEEYVIDFNTAVFSKQAIRANEEFQVPDYEDFKDGTCYSNCYEYKHSNSSVSNFMNNNGWKPIIKMYYNNGTDKYRTEYLGFAFQSHIEGYTINVNNTTYDLALGESYPFIYGTNIYETPEKRNGSAFNYSRVNMNSKLVLDGTIIDVLGDYYVPDSKYIPEGYVFTGWYTEPVGGELVTPESTLNKYMSYNEVLELSELINSSPQGQVTNYEGFAPIEIYAHYEPKTVTITYAFDEPIVDVVTVGSPYTLRNGLATTSTQGAKVTFFEVDDRYVTKYTEFRNWNINGIAFEAGQTFYPITDAIVYPSTYSYNESPVFPEDSDPQFIGWFDEPYGNGKIYSSYTGEKDIVFYPYYQGIEPETHLVFVDDVLMGAYYNDSDVIVQPEDISDHYLSLGLFDGEDVVDAIEFYKQKNWNGNADGLGLNGQFEFFEDSYSYHVSQEDPEYIYIYNHYEDYMDTSYILPVLPDTETKHFLGWYTAENGGVKASRYFGYIDDYEQYIIVDNDTQTLKLYAHWEPITNNNKSIVTYSDGYVEEYDKGETLKERDYVLIDSSIYNIVYDYNDGSSRSDHIDYASYCKPSSYHVYSDVYYTSLVGNYTNPSNLVLNEDNYYITVDTSDVSKCVLSPSSLLDPEPTGDNVFVGWYDTPSGGTKYTDISSTYNNSISYLYGMWKNSQDVIITYEDGTLEIVPQGTIKNVPSTEVTSFGQIWIFHSMYPTSDYWRSRDEFGYNPEDYTLTPTKTITTTKWTIDGVINNPGTQITINEDVYIERDRTIEYGATGYHDIELRSEDEGDYIFATWLNDSREVNELVDDISYNSIEDIAKINCIDGTCYASEFYAYWLSSDSDQHFVKFDYENVGRTYSNGDTLNFQYSSISKDLYTVRLYVDNNLHETQVVRSIKEAFSYHYPDSILYHPNESIVLDSSYPHVMNFTTDYITSINTVDLSSGPEKNHYTFEGWYDEPNGEGVKYTSYDGPDDLDLYANYNVDVYTVTTPFGTEEYEYGTVYTLPTNNINKDNEQASLVTFRFNDGVTDDLESYVYRTYTPDGWLIDGVQYNDSTEITLEKSIELVPNYISALVPATFPSDPTREHYDFNGWFDNSQGTGTRYTSYASEESIILYAYWTGELISVIGPDGLIEVSYGTSIDLGVNDIDKDDEVLLNVTFELHNGEPAVEASQIKEFTPNGWLIGDTHYDDYAIIEVTEPFTYVPDYIETITYNNFPSPPNKDDYIFDGWYDQETGGNKITSDEQLVDGMTIHAQYVPEYVTITYPQYDDEEEVEYGYEQDFSEFMDDPTWYLWGANVTLHFNDDANNVEMTGVDIEGTLTGIRVNGVTYGLDTVYTFTENSTVEFIVEDQSIIPLELPVDNLPSKDHYNFVGWYDNPEFTGNMMTEYAGETDIDLYAKWIGEDITISIFRSPGEPEILTMHYGDTYTFEDLEESYTFENGDVIFDFNDGVTPNNVQKQTLTLTNPIWLSYDSLNYQEVEHNAGDQIILTNDLLIAIDGNINTSEIIIPSNPTMEHYVFDGWYDENDNLINPNYIMAPVTYTANWRGEDITIHTPTGDKIVEYGKEYNLGTNNVSKANDDVATVTFKYHNDVDDDYISYVQKSYTPNGWLINGVHYDNGAPITYYEETTEYPDYTSEIIEATFPSDPTKFRKDFIGWYDHEEGGNKVESYSELTDITLHAQWIKHIPNILLPNGDIDHPDENDQYTFRVNDYVKDSESVGTVTFDPMNGSQYIIKNIGKNYTPSGWILNDTHYDDGETITILDDCELIADYTYTTGVTFPDDPVKEYYTFRGWYTAENGGDKVESYDKAESITLYAHYYRTNPELEEYILPWDIPDKATETLATVTFDFMNGQPNETSTVVKKYIANGWLVDGVYHHRGDIIYKSQDTVIEPSYSEVVNGATFPETPMNGTSRFTGWYKENSDDRVYVYKDPVDVTLYARYTDSYALLKTGTEVRTLLNKPLFFSAVESLSYFKRVTRTEYDNRPSYYTVYDIATEDSPYPVYIWLGSEGADGIYYYSEADVIYMNPDSSSMFTNLRVIKEFDISTLDSSYVTNMSGTFQGLSNKYTIDFDITNLDTSNVTDMSRTFGLKNITGLDLSNLNTNKVTNMEGMFSGIGLTELDLSNLNTSSATTMRSMFDWLPNMTHLDLSSFDTHNVTDMYCMFNNSKKLEELDLSNFDTSNVTSFHATFQGLTNLKSLNISSFDVSSATDMQSMFNDSSSLTELDLSSFNIDHEPYFYGMLTKMTNLKTVYVSDKWDNTPYLNKNQTIFESNRKLTGQSGTRFDSYHHGPDYARVDILPDEPGYFTDKYPDKYIITFPDYEEEVNEYVPYTIPTNTYPKDLEVEYVITFNPMNGEDVITSSRIKTYVPTGFTDGENVYLSGSVINIRENMTLTPYYDEVITEADFPEDPTKEYFTFDGWYTQETDGDKVTSLDSIDTDTTLYAYWTAGMVEITGPNGTEVVPYGSEYTFGTNDINKDDEVIATVTFDPNNGDAATTSNVYKRFIPNGWTDGTNSYTDGETIIVTKSIDYEPAYIDTIIAAEFPSDEPVKEHYEFQGWFNGDTEYTTYSGTQDITLTANWIGEIIHVTDKDNNVTDYHYGDSFTLPTNTDTLPDEVIATVTFDPKNGEDVTTQNVVKHYTGGWKVNGIIKTNNTTFTLIEDITYLPYMVDSIIPVTFPSDPVNGDYTFGGWYEEGTNNKFIGTEYSDTKDLCLYAKWLSDPVTLTVDGKSSLVERGYVYVVPKALHTNYDDPQSIVIHLDYNDETNRTEDVSISYGTTIKYQLINGTKYKPESTYVVNEDTTVVTSYDWDAGVSMSPQIIEPTRDNYTFKGWYLDNTDYDDVEDINVDIYSITPTDVFFDGKTLHAEWLQYNPETEVVVNYIDSYAKKNYKVVVPKGTVITLEELDTIHNTLSINLSNNIDDRTGVLTVNTEAYFDHYDIDDEYYYSGIYKVNKNTTIEIIRTISNDTNCSGDLCVLRDYYPNDKFEDYVFEGWYTEANGEGNLVDFNYISLNNSVYGSDNSYSNLYAYLTEVGEEYVLLVVDGKKSIIPKGPGVIPEWTNPYDDYNIIVTYRFNDGVTPDYLQIITNSFGFDYYDVNGDEYQPGDPYDYQEDTYIYSQGHNSYTNNELLTNDAEDFVGWYDNPEFDSEPIESLDNIWDDLTLYAKYDRAPVNVTFMGETTQVPYGYTVDLEYFSGYTATDDGATITYHDASGYYDGTVWTLTVDKVPVKITMNDVEYNLEGEYTFLEDTIIELVLEDHPQEMELIPAEWMEYEHYTFNGWYLNDEFTGDPITTYVGTENIDVYAKWIGDDVLVYVNEDYEHPEVYHYGDTYTFGELPESFVYDSGNVIFDFNDGVTPNSVQQLLLTVIPDVWYYDGFDVNGEQTNLDFEPNETVTLYGDAEVFVGSEDDDNYSYSGVIIPEVPGREHYSFTGWFNEWDSEITSINDLYGDDQVITAHYKGEDITVHLPDEDITVEYGKEYDTPVNNYPKDNTEEATVTFKYHDETTDDYVTHVYKSYEPSGWLIKGEHYGEDKIVYYEETTLVPDYTETIIPAIFPDNPTWARHDFDGWFTEETDGEQITSYSESVDAVLHAQWHDHVPIIITPEGPVPCPNKTFTFGTNNYPKDGVKVGTVTFEPQNGEVSISKDIIKSYEPNGWLLDGVHYSDGETITVLDDNTITPDYIEIISVEYPTDPVKTYYTFKGWYNASNGGDKVENYNKEDSITLYAHYRQTNPDGEEYILPSNQPVKPTEILATVTFDPHNGDPITTSTVTKKWLAKGWLVDGELHYNGDIIYKTPDTVIEPNYTYVIVPAQFPIAPTRGNERYTGWFTEETGGEQVKRYSGTENITLHAQYTDSYAILKPGREVHAIMKNSTFGSFGRGTAEQFQNVTNPKIISTDDSPYPVYFWVQYYGGNTPSGAYYYSEADVIYFNEDSEFFFAFDFSGLCNFDLSQLNSSYVTNFSYFFWGVCYNTDTLPIDQLDTSNGTDFRYMLASTGAHYFDFSNFNTSRATTMGAFLASNDHITSFDLTPLDTSHVTEMNYMLASNHNVVSYDLSNFDTSSVVNMTQLFYGNNKLVSLDLSSFDTRNATEISSLVSYCTSLESVNLSSFDTSNVTNMSYMFKNATSLKEVDISSFDTRNVTIMEGMFRDASNLEKIWVSDKWDISNVTSGNGVFLYSTNIIGQRGTTYDSRYSHITNTVYNRGYIDEAPDRPGYLWNKYATKYKITLPDGIEEVYEGAPFVVPTNTYPKNLEIEYTITFDPMNGEDIITSSRIKTYVPNGFTDGENVYESGSTIYVTGDMTLTPYYDEVITEAEFPEDPTKVNATFDGWYTQETDGDKVTSLDSIDTDTTLYAHYATTLPTNITIDSVDVTIVKGYTHQIEITTVPAGLTASYTYSGYSDIITVSDEGLITGVSAGTTSITVSVQDTDITKDISVTVLSDEITSKVYNVTHKDKTGDDYRLIIGGEPETTIEDYLTNVDNPIELLEVYDPDGDKITDYEEFITTGCRLKLVIDETVYDEVIVIIRGDIDEDGYVDVADNLMLRNHILYINLIDDYRIYAADLDEDPEAEYEDMIDASDKARLNKYILNEISSLNE